MDTQYRIKNGCYINAQYQCHMAAGCTLHTTYHILAGGIQKSLTLNKKNYLSLLEKIQENGPLAENDETERARGLGRKTRGD